MSLTITVDLANSTPSDIAKAAKFMLQFIGFQEPAAPQSAMAANMLGQARADTADGAPKMQGALVQQDPATAFAAGVGGNVTISTPLPPPGIPPIPDSYHSDSGDRRAAAAIAMQAALPPPPPPGIEVDAQGVPWDTRIHSGSRAKVQDGTWRQKRNLDPEVLKTVMEELRHTMGVERRAPQPPAPPAPQQVFAPTPAVPPVPVAPVAPEGFIAAPVVVTPNVYPEVPPAPFVTAAAPLAPLAAADTTVPTPPSAGAAPSASPSSVAPTFPALMQKITAGFHAKTITQADITRAVQAVGLTALPMLAARPDLVPAVATELGVAL